jgi:L-2,4-diaminobutyric acid acetyltransferase
MLDEIASREDPRRARFLEATVTPSNEASFRLFRSFAGRHQAVVTEEICFKQEFFPEGAHEEEILLRIGPLDAAEKG